MTRHLPWPSPLIGNYFQGKLQHLFTALILLSFANQAAHGAESESTLQETQIRSLDRSEFGRSPLPHWSPLNNFELNAIASFPVSHENNPDKLLALYLIASGELRTQVEFDAINDRLDHWIEEKMARFSRKNSAIKTGKKLLEAMHEDFFISPSDPSSIGSYDLNQSQLTKIFDDKYYNCISSSMLYIVLAHKLGLKTQAVLIPSHVFVQLNIKNEKPIEIETTSANGFDVKHDKAYYEKSASVWFEERQLSSATYEDYKNRKILSASALGSENMWSQHTKAERMHYQDRMRLAEIKSHLEPMNYLSQKNRLVYYNIEFNYLQEQNDIDTLAQLYNHIDPYLEQLPDKVQSSAAQTDKEFQNLLAWIYSNRAYSFVHSIDPDRGLMLARNYLPKVKNDISDKAKIMANLYLSIGIYALKKAQDSDYTKAKSAFEGIEQQCAAHQSCVKSISKFYSLWGKHYWNKKNWQAAIEIYQEFLLLGSVGSNVQSFHKNTETAYLNWSNEYLLDENWDMTIEKLETCLSQLPAAKKCNARLEEINQTIILMEQ